MTTALIRELAADPRLAYRITVDEYHRMLRAGALEDGAPFELLDGQIVRKIRNARDEDTMTIGAQHTTVVGRLSDLNPKLKRLGCHMRTQSPLTLPPYNEPEPDGATVRGSDTEYLKRHPQAAEVLCVIEIADASLARDRGTKQEVYANCGIPVYVLLNLAERVVEVYTHPLKGKGRYGRSATLTPRQSVTFPAGGGKQMTVPVRRLLP